MVNEIDIPGRELPDRISEAELIELPPVVAGHESLVVRQKLESFYMSVAHMFEAWVKRSENYHTQRCYRSRVWLKIVVSGDWEKAGSGTDQPNWTINGLAEFHIAITLWSNTTSSI
jgi:hypothetical protein